MTCGRRGMDLKQPIRSVFRRIMESRGWAVPGSRLVVGVSGGIDSMVLLHLLINMAGETVFSLFVAHLDHGLRGEEAERDARFVEMMAEKWGIPIEAGKEDVSTIAKKEKLPVQVAARKARYDFFDRVMEKHQADWLVLGHNADDVSETVMMRWLRGSSIEGLRGIPEQNGKIIRPLLSFRRGEIMEYAQLHRIPFVEDSSNRKRAYFRNRVRHDLLPLIEERYQPKFSKRLTNYAKYFNELNTYLLEVCEELSGRIINEKGEIRLEHFVALPVALKRILLETYLLENGWIHEPLDFEELDEILKLAEGTWGTRRIALGKGLWIIREYDRLFVTDTPINSPIHPVTCPVPGSVMINEIDNRMTVAIVEKSAEHFENIGEEVYVDGDKIGTSLWVRSFQPGDRVVLDGTVKVKKLFIDRKIPRRVRLMIPIIGSGEKIIWVGGVCVDYRFHVTKNSRRILQLRFSQPIRMV